MDLLLMANFSTCLFFLPQTLGVVALSTHCTVRQSQATYTVPAPLKVAASIQKTFFGPMHYSVFDQKFVHAHIVKTDKICLKAPILGRFKGCGCNSRATFNGADTVIKSGEFLSFTTHRE